MPLLHYRYFQPVDGRPQYALPAEEDEPPLLRQVYAGVIPAYVDETSEDVLAGLVGRHAMPTRPEGCDFRPAGTGDVFDLGDRGAWQVLPVGFRLVSPEQLKLEHAA